MDIVNPFFKNQNSQAACDKLVSESVTWWKQEDEVIDDITAISIFLT